LKTPACEEEPLEREEEIEAEAQIIVAEINKK